MVVKKEFCKSLRSFCHYGKPSNPPYPPLKKWGNYKELLLKSPFEKGGLRADLRTSDRKEFLAIALSFTEQEIHYPQAWRARRPTRLESLTAMGRPALAAAKME